MKLHITGKFENSDTKLEFFLMLFWKEKAKIRNVIIMWKIHIFSYKLKLSSHKKPDRKQKKQDRKRKSGLEHLRRFDHKNSGEITNTQRNKLRLRFALLY